MNSLKSSISLINLKIKKYKKIFKFLLIYYNKNKTKVNNYFQKLKNINMNNIIVVVFIQFALNFYRKYVIKDKQLIMMFKN